MKLCDVLSSGRGAAHHLYSPADLWSPERRGNFKTVGNLISAYGKARCPSWATLFHIHFIRKKVIHIEVKIPKEIRAHRETIFFRPVCAAVYLCDSRRRSGGRYLSRFGRHHRKRSCKLALSAGSGTSRYRGIFSTITA